MKKLLLLLLLVNFSCFSQSRIPNTYIAYKAVDPIVIDGNAEERSWEKAPFTADFIDIEGEKVPKYQTNLKMLYDDNYMYFYARMEEPHIWGTLKQRDTVIFYNNDFEIFIDPDGDTHNYLEFEMNALNTVWDLLIAKPYREPAPIVDNWNINGLRSAVHVSGTLNNSSDEDDFWSVEVAIPWDALVEVNTHQEVPVEEFWRINFSRVNWEHNLNNGTYSRKKDKNGKYLPEYNWVWSPQGVINMHVPEKWGYVYFSAKTAGEDDSFEIPRDEQLKWYLYELYRAQKSYYTEQGEWAASLKDLGREAVSIAGEKVIPEVELHRSGWNIWLRSPFTGDLLLIREDGEFLKEK